MYHQPSLPPSNHIAIWKRKNKLSFIVVVTGYDPWEFLVISMA